MHIYIYIYTSARARKQKYISTYISLYMKTFLRTGVYSNVWFQCKTSECFLSFKFLSMSSMGSFQWPFHCKKLLLSNKNICWATYLCSCDLFVIFSRVVSYIFFTYLFFIAQYYYIVYKRKNNDDFVIF